MITKVEVPCLCGCYRECEVHKLTIKETAGKISITVTRTAEGYTPSEMKAECDFDDLQRAWNAVKRY